MGLIGKSALPCNGWGWAEKAIGCKWRSCYVSCNHHFLTSGSVVRFLLCIDETLLAKKAGLPSRSLFLWKLNCVIRVKDRMKSSWTDIFMKRMELFFVNWFIQIRKGSISKLHLRLQILSQCVLRRHTCFPSYCWDQEAVLLDPVFSIVIVACVLVS